MSAVAGDPRLVLASRNPGKLLEFRRLLSGSRWEVLSAADVGILSELPEPGETYADNAAAKAAHVSDATGLVALGDDSGIEVEALGGWPGPFSARWLGEGRTDEQRMHGLLAEVERRCPQQRRIRYVAVLALARPGARAVLARGSCDGELAAPRGPGGFGYDPIFLSSDLGVTFAEAPPADKDRVSHRGRAVQELTRSGALRRPVE